MERDKHHFCCAPASIETLLAESLLAVQDRFDKEGVQLSSDIKTASFIHCDEAMIKTAVINLLENAYKLYLIPI